MSMDITNAKYRIDISKRYNDAGNVTIEGLRNNNECMARMQHIAVASGRITSMQEHQHPDDDAPVHDIGFVSES
jgi:hypothetical protein